MKSLLHHRLRALAAGSCLAFVFLTSCGEEKKQSANKFSDPDQLKIAQLADKQDSKELILLLDHQKPTVRSAAAAAFASLQDSAACAPLVRLLADSSLDVRCSAVYALGQIAQPAYTKFIRQFYLDNEDPFCRAAALEALGKMAATAYNEGMLKWMELAVATLDSSRFDNPEERLGWAKAANWFHLSGCADKRLMDRMPWVLQKTDGDARVICAMAMARYKGNWFDDEKHRKYLHDWCGMERSSDVRAIQMLLLAKANDAESEKILRDYLRSTSQIQAVKVNALRAAGRMDGIGSADILPLLTDSDDLVVLEALAALESKLKGIDIQLIDASTGARSAQIKASALKLMAMTGDAGASVKIWQSFSQASDVQDKIFYARALASAKGKAGECIKALLELKEPTIKSALAEALTGLYKAGEFTPGVLADYASRIFDDGDPGASAWMASEIRSEKFSAEDSKKLTLALKALIAKLTLPREVETWNEAVRTINALGIETAEEAPKDFSHPTDWEKVKSIPADQKVRILTTKGPIMLQLDVNSSPASVANFLQAVETSFYDNKTFHRVVPNFVAQGGCPRGDGYGSSDYTIRSEFVRHDYLPGTVGLASAGKDTESCQWFITSMHAPHLEGRYTIIGQVVSGLEIVRLLTIGDRIEKIEII